MKMPETLTETMLAACGITCITCFVYLRKKNPCPGCKSEGIDKPNHCLNCKKKNCAESRGLTHCAQCEEFPCKLVKSLDKSYRQRYQTSLIRNGARLQALGAVEYLQEEKRRWTCRECGGVVCIHDHLCSDCGTQMDLSLL